MKRALRGVRNTHIREGVAETLTYARFLVEHWRRIRTDNSIERLNREGLESRHHPANTWGQGILART